MNPVLNNCPVCGENIEITRLHCRACDTTIEGHFTTAVGPFDRLTAEQLLFVQVFIRCEGKLNRMEKELGLSYPTLRGRLNDLIHTLGYEVGQEDQPPPPMVPEEERRRVLEELSTGRLSPEEALRLIQNN